MKYGCMKTELSSSLESIQLVQTKTKDFNSGLLRGYKDIRWDKEERNVKKNPQESVLKKDRIINDNGREWLECRA